MSKSPRVYSLGWGGCWSQYPSPSLPGVEVWQEFWRDFCNSWLIPLFPMTSFLLLYTPRNFPRNRADDVPLLLSIFSMAPLGLGLLNPLAMVVRVTVVRPMPTSPDSNSALFPAWHHLSPTQKCLQLLKHNRFLSESGPLFTIFLLNQIYYEISPYPKPESHASPSILKSLWAYIYHGRCVGSICLHFIYSYLAFLQKRLIR